MKCDRRARGFLAIRAGLLRVERVLVKNLLPQLAASGTLRDPVRR
jgi:hypothetical protein